MLNTDLFLYRLSSTESVVRGQQVSGHKGDIALGNRLYRYPSMVRQFLIRRQFLRETLSGYIGAAAWTEKIVLSRYGKPRLSGSGPYFSLSYSGGWLLIGVNQQCQVGVDIQKPEVVYSLRDLCELAGWFMSKEEKKYFDEQGPADRRELFFRSWTMKEALGKMRGVGLLEDPTQWHTGFQRGEGSDYLIDIITSHPDFQGAVSISTAAH